MLGTTSSFFFGSWLGFLISGAMLILISLVWFQLSYPLFLKKQLQRWQEFYAASTLDVGFSGRPGSALSLASLDPNRTETGQLGEQVTAEATRGSLEKKSILFNSLVHPGHMGLGDLDHALVVGDTVMLIDSKRWRAGSYSQSQGNVLRDGEPFEGGNISLGKWVQLVYRDLAPEIKIQGYVVLTNPSSFVSGPGIISESIELISLSNFQDLIQATANENETLPSAEVIQYFSSMVTEKSVGAVKAEMTLSDLDIALTQTPY
jgi:hypothetical protein